VTITGFSVEAGSDAIFVRWETASEIGNLGFYVLRSQSAEGTYERLPLDAPSEQFIPSEDDFGVGASYEFTDSQATPGIRYYYKVQDLPASGGGTTVGPESAMIPLPVMPSPTTVPPTPVPPTATSTASVAFWADPETVVAGNCTTLRWQVDQVRAVYLDDTPVTGQGAQVTCPCEPETHVLRVLYRDGRYEEFPLTIGVTGSCSGTGTGTSALPTPTSPELAATSLPTSTPAPSMSSGDPAASATLTPTRERVAAPEPASPLQTPALNPVDGNGYPETYQQAGGTGDLITPVSTRGPVEARQHSGNPLPIVWLLLVAVLGTGMVGGGIWLWKRG
jgi:hypothetical protein